MFIRVDDRLIHGQVVTAWIGKLNAKKIVVVDDKIAVNKMLQKVLQLATPKHVKLIIVSVDNSPETFVNHEEALYLVKSPITAEKLINLYPGNSDVRLCVGNVGKAEGRQKFANSVYLDPDEHEALRRLNQRADIFFQMVPSESAVAFCN